MTHTMQRDELRALVQHAMTLCEVEDVSLAAALNACRCPLETGPCAHARTAQRVARERLARAARVALEVGASLGHDAHAFLAQAVAWALQGQTDLTAASLRVALVYAVLERDSERSWPRAERSADAVLAGLCRRYARCA